MLSEIEDGIVLPAIRSADGGDPEMRDLDATLVEQWRREREDAIGESRRLLGTHQGVMEMIARACLRLFDCAEPAGRKVGDEYGAYLIPFISALAGRIDVSMELVLSGCFDDAVSVLWPYVRDLVKHYCQLDGDEDGQGSFHAKSLAERWSRSVSDSGTSRLEDLVRIAAIAEAPGRLLVGSSPVLRAQLRRLGLPNIARERESVLLELWLVLQVIWQMLYLLLDQVLKENPSESAEDLSTELDRIQILLSQMRTGSSGSSDAF